MAASLLSEYAAGATFGAALFAAGVFAPATIMAQMRLQDFTMVKAMLCASASSALVVYIADRAKYAAMKPRSPQNYGLFAYDGNIVGSSLIGVGMALTGACPGTVFVQAGAGIPSGAFVFFGGILGGLAFAAAQPRLLGFRDSKKRVSSQDARAVAPAALTVPATLDVSPAVVLAGWEILCFAVLRAISAFDRPESAFLDRSGLVSPVFGGLLIGAAQAAAIALTRHSIGTSGAFEDVGRWVKTSLSRGSPNSSKGLLTPSVLFGSGIVSASALLARFFFPSASQSTALVSPIVAIAGGATMVFGSRLAGGCTSGHGISGLATFSWSSLVSVAAMFGAGVLTAAVLA